LGKDFMGSRVGSIVVTCFCIAGIGLSASAQTDFAAAYNEATRLCTQAKKTDEFEQAQQKNSKSVRTRIALLTDWGMWRMLKNPSTPYLDRLAIAYQGSKLVGKADLPLLWQAVAASETLPDGVDPSPCEFICCGGLGIGNWPNRKNIGASRLESHASTFLGRHIESLRQSVEFPLSIEARERAPWVWQMKRAMHIMMESVNRYYSTPGRYPTLVAAARQWHPSNWYEASVRVNSLIRGPHNALRLQTLLRLALTESDLNVAAMASAYMSDLNGSDDYHLKQLVHAAQIVALQQTEREQVASQAAFSAAQLARPSLSSPGEDGLSTATSILAIARWASDHRLDAWTRYYSYASRLCAIVKEPPFQPNPGLHPRGSEVAKSLATFERWFGEHRESLERQAAAERSLLNSLGWELGMTLN
jgi:hypothetical protein